ncbi:MAG: flagellar basal body P-ring protein FlgI [Deltaproteobacteria bacterium]|nr:flagellar basal body P-ring protein FlgI [Deltaproteobacteria bacterium]
MEDRREHGIGERKTRNVGRFVCAALALALALGPAAASEAARLKDMASVKGVRSNQIIGYGLVVGLRGTGDKQQTQFTVQSLRSMLAKMGVSIDPRLIRISNVAAVMVTAKLPAFARTGSSVDVVVSSVGDAASLKGGTLLMTPLVGGDGQIYAVAQGPLAVGGFSAEGSGSSVSQNHPTVGTVVGGATVEREVAYSMVGQDEFEIALHQPDFTTAMRAAARINEEFREPVAIARDSGTLDLTLPAAYQKDAVGFMARVEMLEIAPDRAARVILNERTGTVVMGDTVRIATVAVAHGNLTVVVDQMNDVSQPAPFSDGETTPVQNSAISTTQDESQLTVIEETVTIGDLVRALNAMGTTPTDLVSIIQAIKAAGALSADVETM